MFACWCDSMQFQKDGCAADFQIAVHVENLLCSKRYLPFHNIDAYIPGVAFTNMV